MGPYPVAVGVRCLSIQKKRATRSNAVYTKSDENVFTSPPLLMVAKQHGNERQGGCRTPQATVAFIVPKCRLLHLRGGWV